MGIRLFGELGKSVGNCFFCGLFLTFFTTFFTFSSAFSLTTFPTVVTTISLVFSSTTFTAFFLVASLTKRALTWSMYVFGDGRFSRNGLMLALILFVFSMIDLFFLSEIHFGSIDNWRTHDVTIGVKWCKWVDSTSKQIATHEVLDSDSAASFICPKSYQRPLVKNARNITQIS